MFLLNQFREETGSDDSEYYDSTCRRSSHQGGLMKKRTHIVEKRQVKLNIDSGWVLSYDSTLSKALSYQTNVALCISGLGGLKY